LCGKFYDTRIMTDNESSVHYNDSLYSPRNCRLERLFQVFRAAQFQSLDT